MTNASNIWLLAALPLFGCASALDFPEDPTLVETGPWRCLGSVEAPAKPTEPTATVRVRMCNFIDQCATTVTGLTAKLCAKADVGCLEPIAANVREEKGELRLEVPTTGFDGYLSVAAPLKRCTEFGASSNALCSLATQLQGCVLSDPTSAGCLIPTYAPAMLFFNPPIVADSVEPIELPLVPSSGFDSMLKASGVVPNITGGNMLLNVRDCDGKPATGVTFSFSPGESKGTQLYLASGLPSTAASQTDSSGVGGFMGVLAGLGLFVEVSAHNSDGVLIGKMGVQAAPGTVTYGTIVPQ